MPTNRKRKPRKFIPEIPEWQLEYLRTGHIEVDPVFKGLPETLPLEDGVGYVSAEVCEDG